MSVLSIQSHVTYGHAGNSAAVFPIQRMGLEVWPIHTVHFSNHTQHPQGWTGKAVSADAIAELFEGLERLGIIGEIKAIITGYLGEAAQCDVIAEIVRKVKAQNPDCLYVCDPVMGSPEKGCIVSDGVAESLLETLMPLADIIVPNQFELTQFTQTQIGTLEEAIAAVKQARTLGPQTVLVKHLSSVSRNLFTMLMADTNGVYIAERPHLAFEKQPVGMGDLISATFLASLLRGQNNLAAFEHCHNATYGILKETHRQAKWELQIIAAQAEFEQATSKHRPRLVS